MKLILRLALLLMLLFQTAAQAQQSQESTEDQVAVEDLEEQRKKLLKDLKSVETSLAEARQDELEESGAADVLTGLGLAAGVGVVFLDEPDISDVSLDNGVVKVGTEEKIKNGFWFETHYSFGRGHKKIFHGPFLGVQVTDGSDFLKTVGIGWMVSLKRKPLDSEDKGAFNLGFGVCNTKIQELAAGVTEGDPLPAGQESVGVKSKNVLGGMLVFSFTFL